MVGCSNEATRESLILSFVDKGSHRRSGPCGDPTYAINRYSAPLRYGCGKRDVSRRAGHSRHRIDDQPTLANFRTISTALSLLLMARMSSGSIIMSNSPSSVRICGCPRLAPRSEENDRSQRKRGSKSRTTPDGSFACSRMNGSCCEASNGDCFSTRRMAIGTVWRLANRRKKSSPWQVASLAGGL